MSAPTPPGSPQDGSPDSPADGRLLNPLVPTDPPRVGPYWLDSRLRSGPSGVAYLAHTDEGDEAVVVRLSEGSAADAAARDRFAGLVNKLHIDSVLARGGQSQDTGRWARKFIPEEGLAGHDDEPEAPWVALAHTGTEDDRVLADHLLAEVELRTLGQQGTPSGPDYRHYWLHKVRPGLTKVWPLPWPGRRDRAGWPTVLISWLLMMLLAVLAVLIAIWLFHDEPPSPPPEPIPQSGSGSGTGSPPPQSGSPSPQGSPSETGSPSQSGSGSPSGSPSPTQGSGSPSSASASPQPSGTESGGGQQSPRSRL
ncbi:hypothetical protein [Microlunatus sp. Y2014]|uniref:hypothetical protein n=1 Tax=Microlunatus sp. Y2014 TaxID=3418488 RepID=UPI003DA6EF75